MFEPLEPRQLFAGWTGYNPSFVGPLPVTNDPQNHTTFPGGRPTSELVASPLKTPGQSSYTFTVIYRDDAAVRVSSIDSYDVYVYGPHRYVRRALLVSVDSTTDGPKRVARYKVGPAGGSWDASDNGWYTIVLQPNEVTDVYGTAAPDGIMGQFAVQVPGVGGPLVTPVRLGVNVTDFGAIANDGIDDTAAIVAAINSLPLSDGAPSGRSPAGGVVLFPAGVFDVRGQIRLRSGITIRGAGASSTVIRDLSTDRYHAIFQLYSPFTHHFNIATTIENVTLYAQWAQGVTVDPNMGGDLVDFRLANMRISSLGAAIDLRYVATYHSDFDNVEVYNPGSTALDLGRQDGLGAVNRIRNFRVTGVARNGFRPETALVHINCDVLVQGMTLTTSGGKVLPLFVRGRATFNGLDIQVPAADCPNRYAAHFFETAYVLMDSVIGVGTGRRLRLTSARDVQVTYMRSDGTSALLSQLASIDSRSYLRVSNAINGQLQATAPPTPPPAHVASPVPTNVISATDFGVIPNDGIDDTLALQAAINSLPKGSGIPGSGEPVGGIVQLPLGTINTTGSIKLPSGVWLRGQFNGTVINNLSLGAARAVIELTSPYTHHSNIGAAVIDVGIFTTTAAGIKADATITGELRDFRMSGDRLSTGGCAVDLRSVRVNYANFDRVVVTDPGSTVLWLGKADNSSVGNIVRGFRVIGVARPGFVAEQALFNFYGDTRIEGGSIEDTFAVVLPFYASGKINIFDMYVEYPAQADNLGYVFDRATGYVDNLYHVDPQRRINVINSSNVTMGNLNIDGFTTTLRDCVGVDGGSKLTLNTVNGQWDSGMLDHPRVIVKGHYNTRAGNFVETKIANSTPNLLADPGMLSVGDDVWGQSDWQIIWGNGFQGRLGSFVVETVNGVKRLRIDVPAVTNVSLHIRLNVPANMTGTPGIARWRMDGPTQAFVYMHEWGVQLPARVMNSMTAAKTPFNLAAGDQIWITLPQAKGTYYFWKFGMAAA